MAWVNPIPYIDESNSFEIRLKIESDEIMTVDEAKKSAAEYLQSLSIKDLCDLLACEIHPVYPKK